MTNKERIEELERRVRELEARPIVPTIVIQPAPPNPQWYPYPYVPWYPAQPYIEPTWYITTSTTVIS